MNSEVQFVSLSFHATSIFVNPAQTNIFFRLFEIKADPSGPAV